MKFLIAIVLIAVLSFAVQQFFPWWSVAIVAFAVGFVMRQPRREAAFFAGLLSLFLLWTFYSYYLAHANQHLLSEKLAELFAPIIRDKQFRLYILTGAIGGLVGGFASLSGRLSAIAVGMK
ncbi:MAG: hypothetical protein IPP77_14855 [Bacteroidetes bacterium]|nr:hypothetical protein [Bacteroidota bacterium]